MPEHRAYRARRAKRTLGAILITVAMLQAPAYAFPDAGRPHIHLVLATHPPRVLTIWVGDLYHTLAVDFSTEDDGTVYVETGDIPAMWLRDSSAQAMPYVRFAPVFESHELSPLIRGVIERNSKNVLTDPYANAFTQDYKVWEEKWEVDSLSYPVGLAWSYWNVTRDRGMFTLRLHWALAHILATYECEQRHLTCSRYTSRYLVNGGHGPYYAKTWMIWSAFRPSDEPVRYPYNIPQQMFAAVALQELADLAEIGYRDEGLAARARLLSIQVRASIERYGEVYDFRHGWMYAYEVDGYGNSELMDDANLPNLISASLYAYTSPDDVLYEDTRDFSLSTDNPFYYRGAYAAGLGSSHTPTGWVWPLGMIVRALTADSWDEVALSLAQLRASGGSEAVFHESLDPDRPWRFTRSAFGWPNATYAELLFRSAAGIPAVDPPLDPFVWPAKTPQMPGQIERWNNAGIMTAELQRLLSSF